MSAPATESALLIAARQLADEALERSRQGHARRRASRSARLARDGARVGAAP